jgi:hypothetical protein
MVGGPTVPGLQNQVGPASEKGSRTSGPESAFQAPMWRANFGRALGLRQVVPRPSSSASSRIRRQTRPLMVSIMNSVCLDGEESADILIEYPRRFELPVSSKKCTCRADRISGEEHCVSTMFRVVWSTYIDPFIEQPSLFYLCLELRTPAGRSESHNPCLNHDYSAILTTNILPMSPWH